VDPRRRSVLQLGAFATLALAEAEVGDTSKTLSGTLRVAGSAFFVGHCVVPAIRAFSRQHPSVKFDLCISEEFADPVRTGVDLMIRIGQLPPSPMKSRKIASLRRVAIASPSHVAQRGRPETPADLAQHAFLAQRLKKEII
jgi:DNA-binding transcriptional LysR family regulator